MDSQKAALRAKYNTEHPQVQIDLKLVNDPNLSLEDVGVMVWAYSLLPNEEITIAEIMREGNIGRHKATRIVNKLIGLGYLARGAEQPEKDGQ